MKKFLFLCWLVCAITSLFAQENVVLTFTGKNASNDYVQLNKVIVKNITQDWEDTLIYPDTIMMLGSVGIDDNATHPFTLSQNVPNPFDGVSDFTLQLPDAGDVFLEVHDLQGKRITHYKNKFTEGLHFFRVQLSTAQSYVLTASFGKRKQSIKMVNKGNAGYDRIQYLGDGMKHTMSIQLDDYKLNSTKPFTPGDYMSYVGYALIDGVEYQSETIEQSQYVSQSFDLIFPNVIFPPRVTVSIVTDVCTSAEGGGEVMSDGGDVVTARGVCWSLAPNPTIADSHTVDSAGLGYFTSLLSDLLPDTLYYVRAYATNSAGTSYSEEIMFSTPSLPVVSITALSVVNASSVIVEGNISLDGGSPVTARGVCWGTTPTPTINDNCIVNGTGIGHFSNSLVNILQDTTYYVRTYATNCLGTNYSEAMMFTTTAAQAFVCGSSMITDFDANLYNTVQIGEQCWMKENVRSEHFSDGTLIAAATGHSASGSIPYRFSFNNIGRLEYLYNWPAATNCDSGSNAYPSGVQGICPAGWHLPSMAEWNILNDYVGKQSQYVCGDLSANTAKALASDSLWVLDTNFCAVGNMQQHNNGTGFTALPVGYCSHNSSNISFTGQGFVASFWSSVPYSTDRAIYVNLHHYGSVLYSGNRMRFHAAAVRCLKDYGELATVVTDTVSVVTAYAAKGGGKIVSYGNTSVIACGVCWSTSPEPTIADAHTSDAVEDSSFISIMQGLSANTTYYVRSYVTNAFGTSYGNEISFTTNNSYDFVCELAQAIDFDGNNYNTIQIGTQCWTKENLRTVHYGDGTLIALGDTLNRTIPYRYYPNGDSNNVSTYGFLYNSAAVINGEHSSNKVPSEVRGICPEGWHLPSDAEWYILENFVSSQQGYVCNSTTNIAKALASDIGWSSSTGSCEVGNNQSSNNASRFSALPAGYEAHNTNPYASNFWKRGAYFWTATLYQNNENALLRYARYLQYNSAILHRYPCNTFDAYSVRCLRDYILPPTVTIGEVTNIGLDSAVVIGNVTADGGDSVSERGICWSMSPNPTTDDEALIAGGGEGSFTSILTNLSEGTTYYVRAYAINNAGTGYSEQVSFTTNMPAFECGSSTVCDYDGNVYHTMRIGLQCWTKENMRAEHFSDGTSIPHRNTQVSGNGIARYSPNNSAANVAAYGYLYTRRAALNNVDNSTAKPSGVQGVCPVGWHVPSMAEWNTLFSYVGSQIAYQCDNNSANIAVALASTTGWNSSTKNCAVGTSPSNNNATGFSAMPAGNGYGYYLEFGQNAYFWTTNKHSFYEGTRIQINYDTSKVTSDNVTDMMPYSVRCVHDVYFAPNIPTISIDTFKNITPYSARCDVQVASDGGFAVTERGVCWKSSPSPTVEEDDHTSNGVGIGTFTSEILDLSSDVTYYVRAYATNAMGTAYSEEKVFNTLSLSLPIVTTNEVSDISIYSATAGGTVVSAGNDTIVVSGVCWSTVPNPTVADSHTTDGTGIGSFVSHLTGLAFSTTYYVRAYATNNAGTAYGEERTFTTLSLSMPSVITGAVSNINTTTATCGGTVVEDGGDGVIARGVCWSTSHNPTIADNHTVDGVGLGDFSSEITGLTPATTFYLRAYATNDLGTAYGEEVVFVTPAFSLPTVTTKMVSDISATTAKSGGTVVSTGGLFIIARGVCWSTSPDPTVADNHTTDGAALGNFVSNITGLDANTTYYLRAYATNSVGTAYGTPVVFTTTTLNVNDGQPCSGNATVTDYDGNTYHTVQIGTQCWMKENMRAEHYSDGTSIALGSDTSSTIAYRYCPNNSSYYVATYGYLYNWPAAMKGVAYSNVNPCGEQGVCPTGWHLPSDAEWTVLTDYVSAQSQYQCGGNASQIAKALASTNEWSSSTETCAIGNMVENNNATGFSALPAGVFYKTNYQGFIVHAYFWTSTGGSQYAYFRQMSNFMPKVYRYDTYYHSGHSVRCLRDQSTIPSVTTGSVSNISFSSATCEGNVVCDGNEPVTARGVCWSTSHNPTVNNAHTIEGGGVGGFTSNLTNLSIGATYYVRAYATNSLGTAYGVEVSFIATRFPIISTAAITNVTGTNATCGGNVLDEGSNPVAARGVCWSTSPNPTLNDTHTVDGSGPGSFVSSLTNLSPGITYYVRAYATNGIGTAYGNELVFNTIVDIYNPCPGTPTVTDFDGNVYNTVQIGTQCWMRENLRTTHYSDGTIIASGTGSSYDQPYRYCPNNDANNVDDYGYLYNWKAVVRNEDVSQQVQGICPTGWHVPRDNEFKTLKNYVKAQSEFQCGNNESYIAKSLASNSGWRNSTYSCAVGNNQFNNNATGFTAVPAGYYELNGNNCQGFGEGTHFWSTQIGINDTTGANGYIMSYGGAVFSDSFINQRVGRSVRCVRN